jgi:hypothetical protein
LRLGVFKRMKIGRRRICGGSVFSMIHKRFILKDITFNASFISFETLRHFEDYTGLEGVSIG